SFFESQGRMGELTRYVLSEALSKYNDWRGPYPPGFSINLALSDLADEAFVSHFKVLLRDHNFPAELITLECPMPAVDCDIAVTTRNFERLAQTGARLAIEVRGRTNDFLRKIDPFPFDEIKTGGAAILRFARTVRGPGLSAISELLELANASKAAITAVGVEDQPSLSALRSLGFAAAQGNHLGKVGDLSSFTPSRVNEVRDLLGLEPLEQSDLTALFRTGAPNAETAAPASPAASAPKQTPNAEQSAPEPETPFPPHETGDLASAAGDDDLIDRLAARIAENEAGVAPKSKRQSARKAAAIARARRRSEASSPKPEPTAPSQGETPAERAASIRTAKDLQNRLSEEFDERAPKPKSNPNVKEPATSVDAASNKATPKKAAQPVARPEPDRRKRSARTTAATAATRVNTSGDPAQPRTTHSDDQTPDQKPAIALNAGASATANDAAPARTTKPASPAPSSAPRAIDDAPVSSRSQEETSSLNASQSGEPRATERPSVSDRTSEAALDVAADVAAATEDAATTSAKQAETPTALAEPSPVRDGATGRSETEEEPQTAASAEKASTSGADSGANRQTEEPLAEAAAAPSTKSAVRDAAESDQGSQTDNKSSTTTEEQAKPQQTSVDAAETAPQHTDDEKKEHKEQRLVVDGSLSKNALQQQPTAGTEAAQAPETKMSVGSARAQFIPVLKVGGEARPAAGASTAASSSTRPRSNDIEIEDPAKVVVQKAPQTNPAAKNEIARDVSSPATETAQTAEPVGRESATETPATEIPATDRRPERADQSEIDDHAETTAIESDAPQRRARGRKNFLTRKYRLWPDHFWPKSWKRAWKRRAAYHADLRAAREAAE
ncbi:MAG: EAL domain-containing protein, partial [Pseudomonadota bacterium]